MRRLDVDVVDAHNVHAQFWTAPLAALARVPRVATVHSEYRREYGGRVRGRAYEAVLRMNRRFGARFIAVSPNVASYLRGLGVDEARLVTIPNGIAAGAGGPSAVHARQQLGISAASTILLCLARLETVKGHDTLLQAVAELVVDVPNLVVLLAGDGSQRDRLERLVLHLGLTGNVRFLGHRTDPELLLAACDAVCLPSVGTEGIPYALLEAAAAGRPIVATAVGGVATTFTDGHNAILVAPDDAAALADGLRRVILDREMASHVVNAARHLVETQYGAVAMTRATLIAYRSWFGFIHSPTSPSGHQC